MNTKKNPNPTTGKPWYQSVTLWGVLITTASVLAEQSGSLDGLVGAEVAAHIGIVAGLIVTTVGRLRADHHLHM